MQIKRHLRSNLRLRPLALILLGILAVYFADYVGFLGGLDTNLYDISFRVRGKHAHNNDIVLITIDEKTLHDLGRWPLNRKYYTQLLEKLKRAKVIGLNLIFSEPSAEDHNLSRAIAADGNVVLPIYIDNNYNVIEPFKQARAKFGHIHINQDQDGLVRSVFNEIRVKGETFPSFALALYQQMTQRGKQNVRTADKGESGSGPAVIHQEEQMMINYYGPPGIFKRIPLAYALTDKISPDYFADKIVIIGVAVPGVENTIMTPFSRSYGGMTSSEFYATIVNNLMDQSRIRTMSKPLLWIAIVLVSVLGFIVFFSARPAISFVLFVSSSVLVLIVTFLFFKFSNTWIHPGLLIASLFLMFLFSYMDRLKLIDASLEKAKSVLEDSFDTIHDAIIIQDRRGVIVTRNKSAEKLQSPTINNHIEKTYNVFLEKVRRRPEKHKKVTNGSDHVFIEKDIFLPDMGKHVEIRSLPRMGKEGGFDGAVHVIRDITEMVTKEEEHRMLESQLIQAQKMEALGTLAGGIAHDFNNILSAIIGYTELALYSIKDNKQIKGYLEQTLLGGRRATELVKQILTFSRQTELEMKPIKISSIVKETMKLLRSTLPSTIEIRQFVEDSQMVKGNPTQIHQIVMNLCTNAYHAMQDEGGILTVSVKDTVFDPNTGVPSSDLLANTCVELTVSDTGHGIPQTSLNKIFDPYYTTKKRGKGTGLGLAVVHGIVRAHGGAITVESQIGKGTSFHVFLPAIELEEQTAGDEADTLIRGDERILLVDDEPSLIDVEKQLLEHLGYSVTTLNNSMEALKAFRSKPNDYDLVITDMTMPELTGENLAKEILKIRSDIPIVLCTGFSERMTEEKAKKLGITEFVDKPILMIDFARAVRRALDGMKTS